MNENRYIFEDKESYLSFVKIMGFIAPQAHLLKAIKLGYINPDPVDESGEEKKRYIFENEDECKKFLQTCYPLDIIEFEFYEKYVKQAKLHGYIRPNPVDDAEELYSRHVEYKGNISDEEKNNSIDKMYEAIQYLKQQLKNQK